MSNKTKFKKPYKKNKRNYINTYKNSIRNGIIYNFFH